MDQFSDQLVPHLDFHRHLHDLQVGFSDSHRRGFERAVRHHDDGRIGGHHAGDDGRRLGVTVGHFPHHDGGEFHYFRSPPPARVLVSSLRSGLLSDRTVHVLAAHHLLSV